MGNEFFLFMFVTDMYKRHSVLGRTVTELKNITIFWASLGLSGLKAK
jgi:hypothetical protein